MGACPVGDRRVVHRRFEKRRVDIDGRTEIVRRRLPNVVRCRRERTSPPSKGDRTVPSTLPIAPPTTTTTTTTPGNSGNFDPSVTSQWAGYFETPGTVTSVSATWIVPTLACSSAEALSSTWVGVGGFAGGTLLQAGMYDNCFDGVGVQGAFAEEYPGQTVSFEIGITPGDAVTATVSLTSSGWQTTVIDLTTGESATEDWSDYEGGDSAGWIAEAYGAPGGVPVTNFGSEQLSSLLVNGMPAQIPEADVYAMANVSPTDPASGVYRLTYE